MARVFEIPHYYRSPIVSTIKRVIRENDPKKRDRRPAILDLGPVRFKIARHFGFCFGVENAIEIAYRALAENPDRRVYLLSEMIHNPHVNADLLARGVKFILNTDGTQIVPFESLEADDIVIVPAFGTTVELFSKLESIGVDFRTYNTTCPFVERVWKRAAQLGKDGFTVIIHGKHFHEETRATFSHAAQTAPSLVIRDMQEAKVLAEYLLGERSLEEFGRDFPARSSVGFVPQRDLQRIGVVNQTTMLARETQEISDFLRQVMTKRHGEQALAHHFADTRDTLCYATSENQDAVKELIREGGDLALVVGGYNSSNTSHLYKLCREKVPSYYIKDADEILSPMEIRHLNVEKKETEINQGWLPREREKLDILITAGASCPDILVDQVLEKIGSFFGLAADSQRWIESYQQPPPKVA